MFFKTGNALNSQHVPCLEEVPFIAIKAQLIGSKMQRATATLKAQKK